MTGVQPLGDEKRQNDFPSAAAAPNGDIWVTWVSYSGLRDEVHARLFSKGHWYATFPVPGVSGDVWRPQVAIDGKGNPWFLWSQLVDYPAHQGERPNWDLFATKYENGTWLTPQRLSTDPGPDINHRFVADRNGRLLIVWQGFRNGQSDVFLRTNSGGNWSKEQRVSVSTANDWWPDVAIDSRGSATVVWDTYASGNYDVRMRTLRGTEWGEELPVASTRGGEASATVAYDKLDRLWIAYEELGLNWGKDSGGRTLGVKQYGRALGIRRTVRVKILANGNWMQPAQDISKVQPPSEENWMSAPSLEADGEGRVWLLYRHKRSIYSTWTWAIDSDRTPNASGIRSYWNTYATHYDGDTWLVASEMPNSRDRMSSFMAGTAAPNGQFWTFWHTDSRHESQPHVPMKDQVWSAVLTAASKPRPYVLVPFVESVMEDAPLSPITEVVDVKALRTLRVNINDKSNRLFKGDLHRHTELSTDGGGRTDGSILDFYRYMIDSAEMDYGAITDHSVGGDYEYWWWLIQKTTDMHHVPGRYASLFGYERTPHWPKGHKNIIHAMRNIPLVKFFFRPDVPEQWSTYAVIAGDLVDNDTKLLFDEVGKTRGIAIPHTLATSQGNDWKDTSEDVQPVAEIFQGARSSYEHEGAPGGHRKKPNVPEDLEYNPGGFIWEAWKKGVKIGVIASSDHSSTHLSHAFVYSADDSRAGIVEAIRRRKTYGATDNILLEYWIGDHFMGEEFTVSQMPEIRVKIRGTAAIAKVNLIRSGRYLTTVQPGKPDVEFRYRDFDAQPGSNWYYVRAEQADGHLAWSSPIWVNLVK